MFNYATFPKSLAPDIHALRKSGATALYFFGSILLRALKSKLTVILTYAKKIYCGSNNYV